MIEAKVMETDDLGAQRRSATKDIQREDFTVFEDIEAIVRIVDTELMGDEEYASMGSNPIDRVKRLLGRLHSIANSETRGSRVSREGELLLNRLIQQVERAFDRLPKPLEWHSFHNNDLSMLVQAPFSSERLNSGVVSAMQKKKILGVTSRYVIVARKAGGSGAA